MTRTMTATKAKAELASCIRLARHGEPIVITNHGKPVAAIVSTDDFDRLARLRAAGPEGGLASIAGGWEGSNHLMDRTMAELRRADDEAEEPHSVQLNGHGAQASNGTTSMTGERSHEDARDQDA